MNNWRPATREPDALQAALFDYLRNRAASVYLQPSSSGVHKLGRSDTIMSDGRRLAIELTLNMIDTRSVNHRASILYEIEGQAADSKTAYHIRGQLVLDRKSLAFRSIDLTPTILERRS
ncbi:hypothetical protein [uncultured Cohaesibacter sp.]|uniref:hypothetical protein n=1 Tax=uncultured Cohaesibacter sp. TaxID=1002546 RepID=UPI0029C7A626|nr:hypothetical protein [uncultured Cohaesibacter sp.]